MYFEKCVQIDKKQQKGLFVYFYLLSLLLDIFLVILIAPKQISNISKGYANLAYLAF